MPDIEKIMKLSHTFGVSTDSLLDDQFSIDDFQGKDFETNNYLVKVEDVHDHLKNKRYFAKRIAKAVSIFVLARAVLITFIIPYFVNLIGENTSLVIGLIGALLLSTWGVVQVLIANKQSSGFEQIDSETFDLEYGARGIIEKVKTQYKDNHHRSIILRIVLCIISVVPIFLSLIFEKNQYFDNILIGSLVIMLLIVSA